MRRLVFSLGVAMVLIAAVWGGLAAQVRAGAPDPATAADEALAYVQAQLEPSGGFADAFTTIKVVLAVAAAGRPVETFTATTGATPLDFLAAQAVTYTHNGSPTGTLNAGRTGLLAVAVAAADGDPRAFGGMDLVGALTSVYSPTGGVYGAGGTGNQSWAVLGLAAAQEPIPPTATTYLLGLQHGDGGWGWGPLSDPDTTALVVQALLASGHVTSAHPALVKAVGYFRATQMAAGGWGYEDWVTGEPVLSADSTAAVIQALAAMGYRPATASWATPDGDPHTALLSLRRADGSFAAAGSPVLATAHAVPGLLESPLPILGRVQRSRRALSWLAEVQRADGGWGSAALTADVVLAYAAAGYDPATVVADGGLSAMEALSATAAAYARSGAAEAGKLVVAVVAAGRWPYDFGGVNVVDLLAQTYDSSTGGAFGDPNDAWDQAWAILGLAAAEQPIPSAAVAHLLAMQAADGSWADAWGYSQADTTGLVLQALRAAGVPPTATCVLSATAYLRAAQGADGGWGNANATAYAIQGLLAVEEPLTAWARGGRTPDHALAAYQKADGPFVWMWTSPWGRPDDDVLATAQAVPALLGRTYPLKPRRALPGDGRRYAGVVVDYTAITGTAHLLEMACVAFTETTISGLTLLERSGIPYSATGGFVTAIRGVTNPPGGTRYWSYWWRHPLSGTWQNYNVGAGEAVIGDGSVDGWHFVDWTQPSRPPSASPAITEICGLPALVTFAPVPRGDDPDRLVVGTPRAVVDGALAVVLPFGSDLNGDGQVTLRWRPVGATDWLTDVVVHRTAGAFTATVPITAPRLDGELQATFADDEGVQYGSSITPQIVLTFTPVRLLRLYLPLIVRRG